MAKIKEDSVKNEILKDCAICGAEFSVSVHEDGTYGGGHYFGTIPIYSDEEMDKMFRSGTYPVDVDGFQMETYNYEPKVEEEIEYWECEGCFGEMVI